MLNSYAFGFYQTGKFMGKLVELPGVTFFNKNQTLYKKQFQYFRSQLEVAKDWCVEVHLIESELRINNLLKLPQEKLTLSYIKTAFTELNKCIETELILVHLLQVPSNKLVYWENPNLFGEEVTKNFGSALYDINEAGKCFALGRDTACVFHLMRVLEHCLRVIAKKLKIKFITNKGATVPVDLQEWGKIINKIEAQIQQMQNRPKSRRKAEDLQFYSELAADFRYFKDAWRNHVMHTNANYDGKESAKIMAHVKSFMEHLATKL